MLNENNLINNTEASFDKLSSTGCPVQVPYESGHTPVQNGILNSFNEPQIVPNPPDPKCIELYTGGMLTGSKILEEINAGHIRITPFDKSKINPNSYNLTLNKTLLVYQDKIIDFKKENPTNKIIIPESGLVLKPNTLYIGRTNERCWTDRYIPQLDGRSSIGRLGITIHVTAGYGDIGWDGTWTLEIMAIHPVRIYPNIEFCQISYHTPYGKTDIQYEGRYQGQIDPTASRSSLDKKVYR